MKKLVKNVFCFCSLFAAFAFRATAAPTKFETITLTNAAPAATIHLLYCPNTAPQHPVILMPGALDSNQPPFWSSNLLQEGYMLAAFTVAHAPDPDPARRPQWLFFDERFAHSYVENGHRAAKDSGRIVKYLIGRGDVHPEKIGWMGSSSTGIPGLAVATQGTRLAAVVAFVSTGAYRQWIETWKPNGLWRGKPDAKWWPETEALLRYDPILHVDKMFPTAVLMVSGSDDKVVDPKTAQAFAEAARPFYKSDPERLRLVLYDGFGHNLPRDVIQTYTESWFHIFMHPTKPPPKPSGDVKNLEESVKRTQINEADHKKVTGAE